MAEVLLEEVQLEPSEPAQFQRAQFEDRGLPPEVEIKSDKKTQKLDLIFLKRLCAFSEFFILILYF